MTTNTNMTPEQFAEWNSAIDKMAKKYGPTRNKRPNAEDFMDAVELMFKTNGWNYNAFLKQAYMNWAARQSKS